MQELGLTSKSAGGADLREPLYIGVAVGFFISLCVLVSGFNQGIMDLHDFRQSQTALTTYWMLHGGDLLAYQTPVIGFPWVIPFEFPVYQWACALVSLTGLPIIQSSRLVSWVFFLTFALFSVRTLERLEVSKSVILTFVILLFCSPLYLFWSRTVLIESTAVMFGAIFLYGLVGYFKKPNLLDAALLLFGLTFCALVKVTTVLNFAVVASVVSLWFLFQRYTADKSLTKILRLALIPIIAAMMALGALLMWLSFADALKAQNPFGETLTSSGLKEFNFGTLEQRLSPNSWFETFFGTSAVETVGSPVIIIISAWLIIKARYMVTPAFLCLGLYILPFLVFTNLHLLHAYYQYANSFFLLLFVAFSVEAISRIETTALSSWSTTRKKYTFLGFVVTFQLLIFSIGYWKLVSQDQSKNPAYKIAAAMKEVIGPEEVAFSFGDSWSSQTSFLSERRVIALPDAAAELALSIADMNVWTGGRKIAAILDCDTNMTAKMKPYVARISAGMNRKAVAHCILYSPK